MSTFKSLVILTPDVTEESDDNCCSSLKLDNTCITMYYMFYLLGCQHVAMLFYNRFRLRCYIGICGRFRPIRILEYIKNSVLYFKKMH